MKYFPLSMKQRESFETCNLCIISLFYFATIIMLIKLNVLSFSIRKHSWFVYICLYTHYYDCVLTHTFIKLCLCVATNIFRITLTQKVGGALWLKSSLEVITKSSQVKLDWLIFILIINNGIFLNVSQYYFNNLQYE